MSQVTLKWIKYMVENPDILKAGSKKSSLMAIQGHIQLDVSFLLLPFGTGSSSKWTSMTDKVTISSAIFVYVTQSSICRAAFIASICRSCCHHRALRDFNKIASLVQAKNRTCSRGLSLYPTIIALINVS